jgi:hypothetical protein
VQITGIALPSHYPQTRMQTYLQEQIHRL